MRVAVAFSRGIRRLRHIEAFLGVERVVTPRAWSTADARDSVVLVWGRKQNASRAQAFARRHDLPVWFLEDGFIRSSASDPHGRLSYSLLVDPVGVYYDSGSPSTLENRLNVPARDFAASTSSDELTEAAACRARLVEHEITKYNYCRQSRIPADLTDANQPLVLVIDQTRDDASVRCGGMHAGGFAQMLQAAIDENPDARVILRTHPDVVTGKRSGYLESEAQRLGIPVIAERDNPMGWLKQASRVYVATSQLGYEALLCGCEVVTFGQPFYAGWGLTDDRSPVARRIHQRTLDELFLVCHQTMPRYRHPMTGESWTLRQCIDHVCLQKREFARNANHFLGIGITPWKRGYVRQYLRSPDGSVKFSRNATAATRSAEGPPEPIDPSSCGQSSTETEPVLVTWSFRDASVAASDRVVRLEDGFLRSSGLGSDFVAPGSLVVDSRGLYFDPTAPSDLEHLLNTMDCTLADVQRAVALRQSVVGSRLSKYNLVASSQPFWKVADKHTVLVIGQVDDDQSVRRGSPQVRSNRELLVAVRQLRPDSNVIYRPHPDVVSGNRHGEIDDVLGQGLADTIDTDSHIIDCIEACDELHTMTSLAGFEALMRGCKVVTHGSPFYAGWGLTEDRLSTPRRVRLRTLDELVYLTLIVYARYVDIDTGEFISPEDRVAALRQQTSAQPQGRTRTPGAALGKLVNIVKGLRYAP